MTPARPRVDSAAALAMICAASVTAQFVAGKAARDALYLANLPVTSLPAMVVATSVCSILFAIASAKFLRRLSPAAFVPAAFAVCAVLFLIEWLLAPAAPTLIARVVYLQVSGAGPILGSGFWLIASERFNPRSAKQSFGGITAAGTLGGLAGGLLAERVAAVFGLTAVLPMLAVINALSAWQIRRLAAPMDAAAATKRVADEPELSPAAPGHGLRALSNLAYLRDLAAVVALGTTGAALADYAFRAEAASTLRQRRDAASFLRPLLCRRQPRHLRRPGRLEPAVARTPRTRRQRRNAVGGAARRRAWGDRRAWPAEHRRGARRRVGLPRLAVPGELRNLLHADGGRRAARRQVDHRRRVRPAGRCGGRRRRLARAAAPGARAAGHGDPLAGGGNGSCRRSW